MKKWIVPLLAVAGIGALGWWGWQVQRAPHAPAVEGKAAAPQPGSAPAPGAKGGPGAPGGPGGPRGPAGVEVGTVTTMALADEATAVGTLRARETVIVKPEVAGRISRLQFTDGMRVARGALLVQLDASVAEAEVLQARAEYGLAQANDQRSADLFQKKFISERARDEAAAALKVSEAKLRLFEARLDKLSIRAPFDGVLGLRNVSVGDFVKEGAELVVLEDIAGMRVDLRLPERFLGQLRRGQSIELAVDAFPSRKFRATLDALDVQIDANGRSVLVRGSLPNADGALRSGMFAKARVVLQDKPRAMVVPEEAVVPMGGDTVVWKIVDGKAMRTKVRTGIRRDARVEVIDGLAVGDVVVTAGQMRLQRDGAEVRIIDPSRRGPPGGPPAGGPPAGAGGPPAAAPPATKPGG